MRILLAASAFAGAMSLSVHAAAQAPQKVAAPLPFVDLDHKQAEATVPPSAPDKHAPRSAAPSRTDAAVKPAAVALPDGRRFAPQPPAALTFGDAPGALWVEGRTYKAQFTAEGFTYVPNFGAKAPQNYPLTLRLADVRTGEAALPLTAAEATRTGHTVRIDRGGVIERYDLSTDAVEQCFELAAPFAGELTLTLEVATELQAANDEQGLRFGSASGHVSYSNAVLIDALGQRAAMSTTFAQGRIHLRLPATALAGLTFPVVVDPVLRTNPAITDVTHVMTDADLAYAATSGQYLVVWTRVFSMTDTDVHALALDGDGNVVPNSFTLIDNGFDRWDNPRVASCGGTFLTVASRREAATGTRAIFGRTRDAASTTTGTSFQISGGEAGDKVLPDVGGEFDAPANFCVVWQRDLSPSDHDIHYRIVSRLGSPVGNVSFVTNTVDDDFRPRIAKSSGRAPAANQFWPVTWQRLLSGVQHDIYIARIRWDGVRTTGASAIDIAADDDIQPSISSLSDGSTDRHFVVAYSTSRTGNRDIYLRAFRDDTAPQLVSHGFLADLENLAAGPRARDQFAPQVDTDGARFAVAYLEAFAPTDRDAYVSTVDLTPALRGVDAHQTLSFSGLDTNAVALVAQRSGGGNSLNGGLAYGVAFDHNSAALPINSSIVASIYSGTAANGGFSVRATGCGGLTLSHAAGSGIPAPGHTLRFELTGHSGPSVLWLGAPTSLALCPPNPCALGANPTVLMPVSSVQVLVPPDPFLLGATLAVQGAALGNGCAALGLALSDAVDVTFR